MSTTTCSVGQKGSVAHAFTRGTGSFLSSLQTLNYKLRTRWIDSLKLRVVTFDQFYVELSYFQFSTNSCEICVHWEHFESNLSSCGDALSRHDKLLGGLAGKVANKLMQNKFHSSTTVSLR
jgi:hypothetical protein